MFSKEIINQFFERVERMPNEHIIALRRACGKTLNELDAATLSVFYSVVPNYIEDYQLNKWLFAASLHCLWKTDKDANVRRISMENALKQLSKEYGMSDSFKKRIFTLLDTDWDEYGFMSDKYLKIARMLKQKGYAVDGRYVLEDLLSWNSEYRNVQRRWARTLNNTSELKEEE